MNIEKREGTELEHEVDPGYSRIYYIFLSIAISYLCIIFIFG